jgi:chromosome segregation ATPase
MAVFRRRPKASRADLDALRAEVTALRDELTRRTEALGEMAARTVGLDERVGAIDVRLTAMTNELGRQIHELGGDIERLATTASTGEGPGAEIVEGLRAGQVRMANEQARYEIAFRQDLAELAEEIRRLAR